MVEGMMMIGSRDIWSEIYSLHPVPKHTGKRARNISFPSALALFNIRSIHNNTSVL